MDKEDATKKYIREHWFPEHKAELKKYGDIEVLNWRKPGTCCYAIRFVFDGSYMYITGDTGEAVFHLTWKAGVHTFNGISTHYFMEKMTAFSDDRYDFNCEQAKEELEEWRKQYLEDNCDMQDDELEEFTENFDNLLDSADECSCREHWVGMVNERHNDFISEIDPDYWEWIYDIGDEVPARIYGYIVALQMASEQLKLKDKIAEMTVKASACDCMPNCEKCCKSNSLARGNTDTPCTEMRKKYHESIWDYK